MSIVIKSDREIAIMREAGRITATVLNTVALAVRPGMETRELDNIAVREAKAMGAIPSFKGYNGYPASLCVSINEEIVHGIPGKRIIKEGDIVSLDFGVIYDGFQGDSAVTVGAGKVTEQAANLMLVTKNALDMGIKAAKEGARLGDISAAIGNYAESKGYSVVREYSGHGIGRDMHEDPLVPNFGQAGTGIKLKKGMTLAIEPMVNIGDWRTKVLKNNWTVVTLDNSLSAHFENTIVITDGEAEILTAL